MEIAGHFVCQIARGAALFFGLARHFQTVFVRAGLKPDFLAAEPLEPGDHIGRNGFIGMADMRLAVGIVDGGGEIEWVRHWRAR